jgi:ATPase subunit of ABC transporter with duplicated ATPase domains
VLDEISTHLDHITVSALMDAPKDYAGEVLLVSHNRFFISSVVERQVVDEEDVMMTMTKGEMRRKQGIGSSI